MPGLPIAPPPQGGPMPLPQTSTDAAGGPPAVPDIVAKVLMLAKQGVISPQQLEQLLAQLMPQGAPDQQGPPQIDPRMAAQAQPMLPRGIQ